MSATQGTRRLLPGGRLAGPMPWVIAIMTFLTVLTTAAGLGIGRTARATGTVLAGKLTIQIVDANPDARTLLRAQLVTELRRLGNVRDVTAIADADVRALLTPWLGVEGLDADVPVPALIDVVLIDAGPRAVDEVTRLVRAVAPAARIDRHADWLGPLAGLLATLVILAGALVGLTAIATAATVMLGARAALDQHRATIDVMHLMGASDTQIARLFERGVALDALSGSALGFVGAIGALLVVGARIAAVGAALFTGATLAWIDWLVVVMIPFVVVGLSIATARVVVLRALAKIL